MSRAGMLWCNNSFLLTWSPTLKALGLQTSQSTGITNLSHCTESLTISFLHRSVLLFLMYLEFSPALSCIKFPYTYDPISELSTVLLLNFFLCHAHVEINSNFSGAWRESARILTARWLWQTWDPPKSPVS